MESIKAYDVIIIGAGLAGVFCALNLDPSLKVALVSKGGVEDTNSFLAQGGVAAPVGSGDSIQNHIEDTLSCGHGAGDPVAVSEMIHSAADAIKRLEAFGVIFDRNEDGSYFLGREGAHRCARILRVGDFTGRAIMEALWKRLKERENVTVMTHTEVINIQVREGYKKAVWLRKDVQSVLEADALVIATGGLGRLFGRTSNNRGITGDGIALAIRAGLETRELGRIQFHPTVFQNLDGPQEGFLISEAVRGEGAILRNERNERFMVSVHEMAELAPRDVVSKAIQSEISHQLRQYVWLDVRHIGSQRMAKHFPTIHAYTAKHGLNLDVDMIPVAPGAHYLMGGIVTDIHGETSMPGVFAVGECACTGVHGKNRLASNSLLEAMVFAVKAAERISALDRSRLLHNDLQNALYIDGFGALSEDMTQWMDLNMGVLRNKAAILEMLDTFEHMTCERMNINSASLELIRRSESIILEREVLRQTLGEWEC